MIAISCASGLFAIINPFTLFLNEQTNPNRTYFQVNQRESIVLPSSSGYLTALNRDYQRIQIFNPKEGDTSKLEISEYQLKSGSTSALIQQAYSNGKVLLLQLNDTGTTYLQLNTLGRQSPFSALQAPLVSFTCYEQRVDILSVYATYNATSYYKLIYRQVGLTTEEDFQTTFTLGSNCGTILRATKRFVAVGCPSADGGKGVISIIGMNEEDGTLKLVSSIVGGVNGESSVGGSLEALEYMDGKQMFLIYTVKTNGGKVSAMKYAEIVWSAEWGLIVYESKMIQQLPSTDSANYGEINLSAAGRHALVTYENFDRIYGFTFCSYTEKSSTSTTCTPCEDGSISPTPSSQSCLTCSSLQQSTSSQDRLSLLCSDYLNPPTSSSSKPIEPLTLAALIIISTGGFCTVLLTLACCKTKGLCCFVSLTDPEQLQHPNEQPRIAQRRREREEFERMRVERRLRLIEVKIGVVRYASVKGGNKQTSCCICFEDFDGGAEVRETPCKHLFHSPCLMQWVKQKLETTHDLQADCPYCRQNLNI
ncbi:hypothetical protein FGO68_gene14908 [Halteria grandinella]|uniref:RING-type domain-containing protein n=1 Tax=Halteria grandinella TaxID=5974 RepID=A0A8J8NG87_HALGN|nr:hypothetical protein FGO68_gene14908 [Halteria grandinella]